MLIVRKITAVMIGVFSIVAGIFLVLNAVTPWLETCGLWDWHVYAAVVIGGIAATGWSLSLTDELDTLGGFGDCLRQVGCYLLIPVTVALSIAFAVLLFPIGVSALALIVGYLLVFVLPIYMRGFVDATMIHDDDTYCK